MGDDDGVKSSLKSFTGSLSKIAIALSTGGLHNILTLIFYRCPCVDLFDLPPDCWNYRQLGSARCATTFNLLYGLSFVLAPAAGLFILGIVVQPTLWKGVTGWLGRENTYRHEWNYFGALMSKVIGLALISPITWICISLLDGEHMACAITPLPYDVGPGDGVYSGCREVSLFFGCTYEYITILMK